MLINYFIIFFIAFKNSAKFFFQRYSLSTVNGYYSIINFISIFLAILFTRLRSFKETIERQLGYQFSDFQDAFAVSSLFLTLFKLYIFLVYLEQVSPIVGIPILILNFIFSLRYNLILVVRELVVALFVNPLFNIKNQLEVFDYSKLFKLEFYLYYLFFILISFRVLIYGEPILFFFLNSFFLYYLLFHKLLFIVFFYSLVLSISRFAFLSSDYTIIKLYKKLNNISHNKDLINRTKRIKFTRKNIIILVSWITRTYEFRNTFLIAQEGAREKSYSIIASNKIFEYTNPVEDYIRKEIAFFRFAIENYNGWRRNSEQIALIFSGKSLDLFDTEVEIKIKHINILFYISCILIIALYVIGFPEYSEIDYIASFVTFKLPKISHLRSNGIVLTTRNGIDSRKEIAKIVEENIVKKNDLQNANLINTLIKPFRKHPWYLLQDGTNNQFAYIVNVSTGIHTEVLTLFQYLIRMNNLVYPLKTKPFLQQNTFLFTPPLKVSIKSLDLTKFIPSTNIVQKKVLEVYEEGYTLVVPDIMKIKPNDPFEMFIEDKYPKQIALNLPYEFKTHFLNPFSCSEFKLTTEMYVDFLNFAIPFCKNQMKNERLSTIERTEYNKMGYQLHLIKHNIITSPNLYWNPFTEPVQDANFEHSVFLELVKFSELALIQKKELCETILDNSDGLTLLRLFWKLSEKDFPEFTPAEIDALCKSIYKNPKGNAYLSYFLEHEEPKKALINTFYITNELLSKDNLLNQEKVPKNYSDFYNDALLFHSQRKPISHDLATIKDKPKIVDNSLDDLD